MAVVGTIPQSDPLPRSGNWDAMIDRGLYLLAESKNSLKSLITEHAARARGLPVVRVNSTSIVVDIHGKAHAFVHMNGPTSSFAGKFFCDQKHITRTFLKNAGLSVVESKDFPRGSHNDALRCAMEIGFPVAIKPASLSRGRGVFVNLANAQEFDNAYAELHAKWNTARFIVERHFRGVDFRFFVVGGRMISATHRVPANVVGDGVSTIRQLIWRKNETRLANPSLLESLIPYQEDQLDSLRGAGRSLQDVPLAGEKVVLRSVANVSSGGDSIDVTDAVHPGFLDIAVRAVAAVPGIAYAGVDILARNITEAPTAENHIVGEVEFSPAPTAQFPVVGQPRDMAGAVIDYYVSRA